jgi:nucleoside-diphosphate-sugar epimerase
MAKYLITGGAGFIGSNLADHLIKAGNQVVVWDDLSTGLDKNLNPAAHFIRFDVSRRNLLFFIDHGFDTIFHLAARPRIQPSFDNPVETHQINIDSMVYVLEHARQYGCKVVFAGSSSVYHDPYANPYTFTKVVCEQYCEMYNKLYGVPVAIARFFNVYGPRQIEEGAYSTVVGIFEKQKRNNETLTITGTGEQRRDFTHVADIADGLTLMAQQKWNAEVFNLGSGCNYSINELASMFNQPTTYLPARPGEAWTTLADIAFSQEALGWTPRHSLPDYVKKFLARLTATVKN